MTWGVCATGVFPQEFFGPKQMYRLRLRRIWGNGPILMFLMLNPSTADEAVNDPTVARCENRAKLLGYSGLTVCNLFAFRATDPEDMKAAADPVGPGNDQAILSEADLAGKIICGWGVHGGYRGRSAEVVSMLRAAGHSLFCLGMTSSGEPGHPLYLPYSMEPRPFTFSYGDVK